MSQFTEISKSAKDLLEDLRKQAFVPMPPDQGPSAPPIAPPQQGMPPEQMQQGGMPPQPGAPMPPPQPGAPQGGQPIPQDPYAMVGQLQQMVQEMGGAIEQVMGVLEQELMPALDEAMQKLNTHDNALVEVNTLANGTANDLRKLMTLLQTGGQALPASEPDLDRE